MIALIVNPVVEDLDRAAIESRANQLLERYIAEIEPYIIPPIPVERMIEVMLNLTIDWAPIPDTDNEPILALIDPVNQTIRLNDLRFEFFERYFGTEAFTFAHEVGHYDLHLIQGETNGDKSIAPQSEQFLCRMRSKDPREEQADQFASYLLMPTKYVIAAIKGIRIDNWKRVYWLAGKFGVSKTAMRKRLEELKLIKVVGRKVVPLQVTF